MKKVAIYCSSREGLPEEIEKGAQLIASVIGQAGGYLVYGGVNAGLMHVVAQAAHDAGAEIIGVVPQVFKHNADPLCDQLIEAKDLNDRKGTMIDLADLFIVLPGGIGTIDEWISTLSHIMVQERINPNADKPILVWNADEMYTGMEAQLADTNESVYARGKRVNRSMIFPTAQALANHLKTLI